MDRRIVAPTHPRNKEELMTKPEDFQARSVPRTDELRQHPRRKLAGMAYVELAQDNGGLLLNLSEGGLAVRSALALSSQEFPELRFHLPNMRGWLTASGRVVWMSDSQKEAGIQFLDLHEHARAQIRMWVGKGGQEEPEAAVAGEVAEGQVSAPAASASRYEPNDDVNTGLPATIEPASANIGSVEEYAGRAPAQDDRGFRFHDYSMFAVDAGAGASWVEPKRRRGWGAYVLFTMLVAVLFFVLGVMVGRDNLNGLLSSVQEWKPIQGEAPPSAKAPRPPDDMGQSTASTGEGTSAVEQNNSGEALSSSNETKPEKNAAQERSTVPKQESREPTKDQIGAEGSAGGAAPAGRAATRTEGGAASAAGVSPAREPGANAKNAEKTKRPASYSNSDAEGPAEYGRSMLVYAPAPGSPPFVVNLPGETVSASAFVAISARRSVQVPPQTAASGSGSERLIIGKLIAHSDPFYPVEARDKRIEGIVELHALVGRSGQVNSVKQVSGPGILAAAGEKALHEWRYEPTFINGDPVETHVDVTMVFRSP
jgi:hypothetical protein